MLRLRRENNGGHPVQAMQKIHYRLWAELLGDGIEISQILILEQISCQTVPWRSTGQSLATSNAMQLQYPITPLLGSVEARLEEEGMGFVLAGLEVVWIMIKLDFD